MNDAISLIAIAGLVAATLAARRANRRLELAAKIILAYAEKEAGSRSADPKTPPIVEADPRTGNVSQIES